MSEHELQNAVLSLCAWRKIPYARINVGKVQNAMTGSWVHGDARKGHPDCIVGRWDEAKQVHEFGYAEIKSKTGRLSMDQISFLRDAHKRNLPWVVVTEMSEFERFLADRNYHGDERHTRLIIDESTRFAPAATKRPKKLTAALLHEFNSWSDKHRPEPPIPF